GLYTVINLPHIDQVHMFFLARLIDGKFGIGEESLEVALFSEAEIPWDEIAFPTVRQTLENFFADRHHHEFPVRVTDITWNRPKYRTAIDRIEPNRTASPARTIQ